MNKQNTKKSQNKDNLQNKNNTKPLIYTFLGTFIVFFIAIMVLLPIISPDVNVPSMTEEHSLNSVNSNDFKGRLDPRLNSIEDEENTAPPKLKMEIPDKTQNTEQGNQTPDERSEMVEPQEPQDVMPDGFSSPKTQVQTPKTTAKTAKPATTANIPPRPQTAQPYTAETTKPVAMSKVIMGSYSTPMQARLVSDTLIEMDMNVSPFIKERNGRYVLQVGSFSDTAKAEGLVQELKNKGFDARVINE